MTDNRAQAHQLYALQAAVSFMTNPAATVRDVAAESEVGCLTAINDSPSHNLRLHFNGEVAYNDLKMLQLSMLYCNQALQLEHMYSGMYLYP